MIILYENAIMAGKQKDICMGVKEGRKERYGGKREILD